MNVIHPNRYPEIIRNFFQNQYDSVVDLFGGNDFYLDVWVTFILSVVPYWFFGALYTILDLTKWPKFLYKYKIQDNEEVYKNFLTKIVVKKLIY